MNQTNRLASIMTPGQAREFDAPWQNLPSDPSANAIRGFETIFMGKSACLTVRSRILAMEASREEGVARNELTDTAYFALHALNRFVADGQLSNEGHVALIDLEDALLRIGPPFEALRAVVNEHLRYVEENDAWTAGRLHGFLANAAIREGDIEGCVIHGNIAVRYYESRPDRSAAAQIRPLTMIVEATLDEWTFREARDEARERLERLIGDPSILVEPESPLAIGALAWCAIDDGNFVEAVKLLDMAIIRADTPKYYGVEAAKDRTFYYHLLQRAEAHLAIGNFDIAVNEGRGAIERIAREVSSDVNLLMQARHRLAAILEGAGYLDEAFELRESLGDEGGGPQGDQFASAPAR